MPQFHNRMIPLPEAVYQKPEFFGEGMIAQEGLVPPVFFVSADSKGVTDAKSVSADSKGVRGDDFG